MELNPHFAAFYIDDHYQLLSFPARMVEAQIQDRAVIMHVLLYSVRQKLKGHKGTAHYKLEPRTTPLLNNTCIMHG